MGKYYLAVDLGASSGRHILGHLENGRLKIEEIHRFENGMKREDGHFVWDTDSLFAEICAGLKKCAVAGKIPTSVGVDTWGVDYVLLDKNRNRAGKSYAYRDHRNDGMREELEKLIPTADLYARTGLQYQVFNTLYQLMAHKKYAADALNRAKHLLMLPDYFHFLLSGEITNEYTEASTSQLLDVHKKDWDRDLIRRIGVDDGIFGELQVPGTRIGRLNKELAAAVGFDCDVVLPATHDTASAVMGVPAAGDDHIYISSGTWSLMGCELQTPVTSDESMKLNYANEGGYDYRYRYLKNIMGL